MGSRQKFKLEYRAFDAASVSAPSHGLMESAIVCEFPPGVAFAGFKSATLDIPI